MPNFQALEMPFALWNTNAFNFSFSVPGIIGCLQALEAIKVASAVGEPLSGRMLLFDALSARIRIVCSFYLFFKVCYWSTLVWKAWLIFLTIYKFQ